MILLCTWLITAAGTGQNLVWRDTVVRVSPLDSAAPVNALVKFRLSQQLEYAVSGTNLLFSNWQQGNSVNFLSLIQHFDHRLLFFNDRNFTITNSFAHELGIQYFFDSISRFQPDDNTLNTSIDIRMAKNLTFSVCSNLTTCMFNSYAYATDPAGNLRKTLKASFLTPLLWTFSAGVTSVLPLTGSLNLGLSAGKFTWIRNNGIYEQQNILEFYGVPLRKRFLLEYGLGLHLLVDKNFLDCIRWKCDVLVFKNYEKSIDLAVKNFVEVRISRFLKASIQTRLNYEKEVSKWIQVENRVTLGFYIRL